jgi:predicted nuclease of predicted toxin-antitoxin system
MRFLIDAQLSRRLAAHLIEVGHEASHVFDHLPRPASDPDVAALAETLRAAVISMDADFVDLARRGALRVPLIWMRTGNIRTDLLRARMYPLLSETVAAIEMGTPILEIR